MKTLIRQKVVVLFILLLANTAAAQSGFFLGPQVGYSSQKIGLPGVEFNRDTAYLYGLRLGFKFMMMSLEVNYFQAVHNLELEKFATLAWGDHEVSYNYIGLNVKYFFPVLVLHPYVTFGYGYYGASITEIDNDRQRGFNLGVGGELHFGSKVSFLVEGRYHRAKIDIEERELTLGDFTFSGGFNIYF